MADLNISGDIQISPTSLTGSLHPTTINLSGDLDTGNGKDGYSPTVDVEVITGGHRITITDRDGAHTFDVVDGTVGVGISDISKTSTHDAEDTYTITYTDGSTTTFVVTNGEVTWNDVGNIAVVSHTQPSSSHNVIWIEDEGTTIELPTMDDLEEVADDVDDLKAEINQLQNGKADIIISSASGTVASFSDGAEYDAVGLVAEFAPYQEGSGDPSPTNVRPIHGWTGLDILTSGEDTSDSTTTPISWQTEAGEVFGGYCNPITGVGNSEWELIDMGDLAWNVSSSTYGSAYSIPTHESDSYPGNNNLVSNMLCDSMEVVSVAEFNGVGIQEGEYWVQINAIGHIYIMSKAFIGKTKAEIETMVTGIKLAYHLATPQPFTFNPTTVSLIKGYNNVWTNAGGNVDVTYKADTTLYLEAHIPEVKVDDVQVDGTSVVNQGVANIPYPAWPKPGVVKVSGDYGVALNSTGTLIAFRATDAQIKDGLNQYRTINPVNQHMATFYGLAKAASDTTQSASSNPVGTYTDAAKIAIQKMLGIYEAPWELIADTTSTEDAGIFAIETDINGQPFQLKKGIVYVEAPHTTTGTRDYIAASWRGVNSGGEESTLIFPNIQWVGATASTLFYYEFDCNGVTPQRTSAIAASGFGSTASYTQTANYINANPASYLKRFNLLQYNNNSSRIPSGTRIRIYGQRYVQ